jgi:hypothetical protein
LTNPEGQISRAGHAAIRHAPKAVIGAAMRKLVHLIYGIVCSGEPFRADFCSPKLDFQDGI